MEVTLRRAPKVMGHVPQCTSRNKTVLYVGFPNLVNKAFD